MPGSRRRPPLKRRKREGFVVGAFPTLKLDVDAVPYASLLELDVLYFLEFDPSIISYTRRPFEILISPAHKPAISYTPDYLVVREPYQELVMISPKDRITSEIGQHIELYTTWSREQGYRFRTLTEEEVRVSHALTNIKLLWRYSRLTVPPHITMRCIAYVNMYGEGVTLAALVAHLAEDDLPMLAAPYVYHLLYHHILQADLNKPLTPQSSIWFTPATPAIEHYVS